jgi:hypothetical protein
LTYILNNKSPISNGSVCISARWIQIKKLKEIVEEIKNSGKSFWITELQAEPWEPNDLVYKGDSPPSFMPEQFEKNLKWGKSFNPSIILLWGFEYWYWRKSIGDLRYWNEAKTTL